MSTPNFSYKNRCVVMTNEDYDLGNRPLFNESMEIDIRSEGYDDRLFFTRVVLIPGHYWDGCIDYLVDDANKYDIYEKIYGSTYCWAENASEFFSNASEAFGISKYRLKKIFGNRQKKDLKEYIDEGCERLITYIIEKEVALCNKVIDEIKERYGYEEYKLTCVFSNGEGIYSKIG